MISRIEAERLKLHDLKLKFDKRWEPLGWRAHGRKACGRALYRHDLERGSREARLALLNIKTDNKTISQIYFTVGRVTAYTHEVLGSLSENGEGAFVLIIRATSLKKNLLRDYVVADKHRGIDTGVLRHATITPVELAFGKGLLILVSPIGIGAARRATSAAAGATRCARGGVGRTSTSIAAARATTVASRVTRNTRAASRATVGAARVGATDSGGSATEKTRGCFEREYRIMACCTSSRVGH
jgi:hypothetical protein